MANKFEKLCQRCVECVAIDGERYCKGCRKCVLAELKLAGYLQDTSIKGINDQRGRKVINSRTIGGSAEMLDDGDG